MEYMEELKASVVMSLCEKHAWLAKRAKELFNLINECQSRNEIILVQELLNKFLIINDEERNAGYEAMADYISRAAKNGKSLMVAMTRGKNPDSGQKVISELRTYLAERGHRKLLKINRFDVLSVKKYKGYDTFIVVDEFVGSGKTILSRERDLRNMFPESYIHFCMLAGMGSNITEIEGQMHCNTHLFCHYKLRKGILGYNSGDELIEKTSTMVKLEQRLESPVGNKDIYDYNFGYGNAQSLIGFGRYNIPNSVFPIFWWPNKDLQRPTLFIRDEEGFE